MTLGGPARVLGACCLISAVALPGHVILSALGRPPGVDVDLLHAGVTWLRLGLGLLGLYIAAAAPYAARLPDPSSRKIRPLPPHRELVILALILVIAAAARLHRLDEPLWWDEIKTYVDYVRPPVGEALLTYDTQNQHFLYTVLAQVSVAGLGDTISALRTPAVIFGLASIAAAYALGRRLLDGRRALLACALLAVSYHHIWFSQSARGYTLLLFWSLISSWLLLRALDDERVASWLAYALSCALGTFTHLTMVCIVAGHFLIYLWQVAAGARSESARASVGFVFGFVPAGLLSFALHALVVPQMIAGTLQEGTDGVAQAWSSPVWALLEALGSMRIAYSGFAVFALLAGLAVVGCLRLARERPMALALLWLPAGIVAAVVILTGHHVWPRFFFFAGGLAAIVLASGAIATSDFLAATLPSGSARAVGAVGVGVLILVSASGMPAAYGPKQDFGAARDFVESRRVPGDEVAVVGACALPYFRYYVTDWHHVVTEGDLERVRSQAGMTWLLYTFPLHLRDVHPGIHALIGNEFEVVARFDGTLSGGEVVVGLAGGAGSDTRGG